MGADLFHYCVDVVKYVYEYANELPETPISLYDVAIGMQGRGSLGQVRHAPGRALFTL